MGMRILRFHDNHVQTPIATYRHPDTGRLVVMFGMIHIGEKAYYEQINLQLKALEDKGFDFLYEGVGGLAPESELNEDQKIIVSHLTGLFKACAEIAELTELSSQKDVIVRTKAIANQDMTFYELVRRLSKSREVVDYIREKKVDETAIAKKLESADKCLIRGAFDFVLRISAKNNWIFRTLASLIRPPKEFYKVIIEERNSIVCNTLTERCSTNDMAIIWGAEHLKGIGRFLETKLGYKLEKTEWTSAYHCRGFRYFTSQKTVEASS